MGFKFEEAVQALSQRADAQGMEPHGRKILIEGNLGTIMGMQVLAGQENVRHAPATVVLEDISGARIHKMLLHKPYKDPNEDMFLEEKITELREAYEKMSSPKIVSGMYKTGSVSRYPSEKEWAEAHE